MIEICKKNQSKINLFKIQRILKLELTIMKFEYEWTIWIFSNLIYDKKNIKKSIKISSK